MVYGCTQWTSDRSVRNEGCPLNATMEPVMATIWELRLIKSGDPVATEVFNNYDQARLAFEEIERKQYSVRAALIERIDGVPKFLRIFHAKQ